VLGIWIALVVLLIGAVAAGYQSWQHSRILPIPAAANIQNVEFGINLGSTSTKWYKLQLPTGKALADVFRGSVVMPPRRDTNLLDEIPPYEYSMRFVDENAREYWLSFRVYSNDIYARGSWAKYSVFVFPASRIPLLKSLVKHVLSSSELDSGRYAYAPGEEDRIHYNRICGLILGMNALQAPALPTSPAR
jgi:hypothetical protein